MFLIPIGHEKDTVRRLPWITFAILAVCFVIHIFVSMGVNKVTSQAELKAQELVEYYLRHPYLEFDAEVKKVLFGGVDDEKIDQLLSYYSQGVTRPGSLILEQEQEQLDLLSENFLGAMNDMPYRKWGYIPAQRSSLTLFTYMFIHAGWLHLLGNLLFLYMTGPFIEDLWGRPIFIAFYLAMGAASALLYAQHYPDFTGPLVGASGAIAGVMGAFLIKYWNIKISFFYFIFPIFRGTFQAPAWLMLPLWVLFELFNAKLVDSINPQGGGVAHWAHVWGFILGMGVAAAMTFFKIEDKYIHPKIEARLRAGDEEFDLVAHAIRLKNLGKLNDAYALLLDKAKEDPSRADVIETLWDFGYEMGEPGVVTELFTRLIEKEIRQGRLESALAHYTDLKRRIPDSFLSPMYTFSLVKYLVDHRDTQRADLFAAEALERIDPQAAPGLLQNFASVAGQLDPATARRIIDLCLKHPEIPLDEKDRLKKIIPGFKPATA